MRTDEGLEDGFTKDEQWGDADGFDASKMAEVDELPDGRVIRRAHSFSGKERNRLFLSDNATSFADMSAISGADSAADSRSFVLWDYDRDGWLDLAVVNANAPLLEIYRNEMAQLPGANGRSLAIRFLGGNTSDRPQPGLSSRNGYGATVTVRVGDKTIKREHRCGEGFAAQNSATMLVGIGAADSVESVTVDWPSGRSQVIRDVAADSLLTADEANGEFQTEPYSRSVRAARRVTRSVARLPLGGSSSGGQLKVYMTMATWCAACKAHLPRVARLRQVVGKRVDLIGLPTDESDDRAKLDAYVQQFQPAYDLRTDLTAEERDQVRNLLRTELGREVLPSSFVTNRSGQVLQVFEGLPTLSDLGRLIDAQSGVVR